MTSAFGIEHGDEVSKVGFKMPGSFKPKKPQNPIKPMGAKIQQAGQRMQTGAVQRNGRFSGGQATLGRGVQRAGNAMQNNPNKFAAGAGAGVAGGGGYAAWKQKQDKKRF